jgi:hypothetical protein
MAFFEDILEGGIGPGLVVVGAVVLAPTVLPVIGRALRPVAKTAIKGGMFLYNEALAGVGDVVGDIVAEARAELDAEGPGEAAAARRGRRGARPSEAAG